MRKTGQKLFNIHSTIGKIFHILIVPVIIVGVIGIIINSLSGKEEAVLYNYFIGDHVPLHNNNYNLIVNHAENKSETTVIEKSGETKTVQDNFIVINITISKTVNSSLKDYKLSNADFKLKDHTGVYIPLNAIVGALGWDAIDVHFDDEKGGHIMSSTDFPTIKAEKDYSYHGRTIDFDKLNLDIVFKAPTHLNVVNDLIVFEVDFYVGANDYKKGSDIILLPNPLTSESC